MPAKTVEEFLASVPKEMRPALAKVRATIKAAAPKATEGISYGVPIFKLDGKGLVGYGATGKHCTRYVMSPAVTRAHASDLKEYKLGKGSIQFTPEKPLPAALVTKLVKARIAENRAT